MVAWVDLLRGSDERTRSLFSHVDLEARARLVHPLRPIREIANVAPSDLSEDFAVLCPPRLGRPSVPPERLLRAVLLQAFYWIHSERQLMERMSSIGRSAGSWGWALLAVTGVWPLAFACFWLARRTIREDFVG